MEVDDSILKIGATSARDKNKNYKYLIIASRLVDMTNSDILKILQEKVNVNLNSSSIDQIPNFKYMKMIDDIPQETKTFIICKRSEGWTWKSLVSLTKIDQVRWRAIISKFK